MAIETAEKTVILHIGGMDCAECAGNVEEAIRELPGVSRVQVLLGAERATVAYNPQTVTTDAMKTAVKEVGYTATKPLADSPEVAQKDVGQIIGWGVLGMVVLVVLLAAVGERFGIFDQAIERLPWWVSALVLLIGGYQIFWGFLKDTWQRRITVGTLMTLGVIASAAIGQWTTALLIVFFMRFAGWIESLTTERSREAIKQLIALAPQTARIIRDGEEVEVSVAEVLPGNTVVVRSGERIPVDGEVLEGFAPVDEASITGESVPKDKAVGDHVFAATIAQAGYLRITATKVGADTTFGRIVRLVEEAEAHKAPVQRFADRFATYYVPVVGVISLLTLLLTRHVLNAVAVVVVACACAIVIATPIVVLACVGSAARKGLLIKGGAALEQLSRINTVVLDKTGTLTYGQPRVTDVVTLNGVGKSEFLQNVATSEYRSEHPLARTIVAEARDRGLAVADPQRFTTIPGRGVLATIGTEEWVVGNRALLTSRSIHVAREAEQAAIALETQGKTVFFAAQGAEIVGLVGVADTVRPDAIAALNALQHLGVTEILLLTGDNERVAKAIAEPLGLSYQAGLLPEDKIEAIKKLQARGRVVLMVGDGVNDAPALAQADVGVAMGMVGTDVAIEAADVALMRDDWSLIPEALRLGKRAARTIRQNLIFTAVYNILGIGFAAVGLLPPVWAAAAQSLPDVAIMVNAARLLPTGAKKSARLKGTKTPQ